jgi:hypothetical protein
MYVRFESAEKSYDQDGEIKNNGRAFKTCKAGKLLQTSDRIGINNINVRQTPSSCSNFTSVYLLARQAIQDSIQNTYIKF